MKVEVKDVLKDVRFLAYNLKNIRFRLENNVYIENRMPTIDVWRSGGVILEFNGGASDFVSKYDVKSVSVSNNGQVVSFSCDAADDIIQIISMAMSMQKTRLKARQHDILVDEVLTAAEQVPYVRHGVGSSGVKAMCNSMEVLKNVVVQQRGHIK